MTKDMKLTFDGQGRLVRIVDRRRPIVPWRVVGVALVIAILGTAGLVWFLSSEISPRGHVSLPDRKEVSP